MNPTLTFGHLGTTWREGARFALLRRSFRHGVMIKFDLGIGLLGTYASVQRDAVPLDLGILISVPLYRNCAARETALAPGPHRVRLVLRDIQRKSRMVSARVKPEEMPSSFDSLIRIFG
jgi:hypothetical protein